MQWIRDELERLCGVLKWQRPLAEADFWFVVGCGPTPTHYSLLGSVIDEICESDRNRIEPSAHTP